MKKKYLVIIIGVAILIKVILFCFSVINDPQSKFVNDSYRYLNTGETMMSAGVFGTRDTNGIPRSDFFIAPVYPLFLGVLHQILKVPLSGVILTQVILTILTAFIAYKAAIEIDSRLGLLTLIILLYSPAITIFSLLILTESMFLLFITLFMFYFVKYLKTGVIRSVLLAGLMFTIAIYVRPGPYFLGIVIAIFIMYANVMHDIKMAIFHALVFLGVVYGLLGLWQIRNYLIFGKAVFSSILSVNTLNSGLFHSYAINHDPSTQGMPPILYYINVTWRCFLSLMTRPGSFKYFHCPPLTVIGKVIAYFWMVFWMVGFLIGVTKIKRNVYYQFLLLVIACFAFGTIIVMMWNVGERFSIPMIPFIAIISAHGWVSLFSLKMESRKSIVPN
jgi:Dolichyl-phosphate-mannose-protein mannosyltransferase